MKIGIKLKNGETSFPMPHFYLEYEEGEWDEIAKKLTELGLKVSKTDRLWGRDMGGHFYKETCNELKALVQQTFTRNFRDDINEPLFDNGLNIAIFRVVPKQNKVIAPLPKFLTIAELNDISSNLADVYRTLFGLAGEGTEVTIRKEVKDAVHQENRG